MAEAERKEEERMVRDAMESMKAEAEAEQKSKSVIKETFQQAEPQVPKPVVSEPVIKTTPV